MQFVQEVQEVQELEAQCTLEQVLKQVRGRALGVDGTD
jgi:hypothetical protein